MKNDKNKIPTCGSSNKRNEQFEKIFSTSEYYHKQIMREAPIIVDVGAHKGESVDFYKSIFPNAKMFCFEPGDDNFKDLENKLLQYKDCKAFKLGISDCSGQATFYLNELSHLGSLRKINTSSKDSLGFAAKAQNHEVTILTSTLDEICVQENILNIDILKIDVQGAEFEVILGAKNVMMNTNLIVMEINLFDFYEKDRHKLSSIFRLLEENNFELFDILNVSKNPKNFRTDWIEAVFKKNGC